MIQTNLLTFHLFNFKHYLGPNPYLNASAVVFDFALFANAKPRAIDDYVLVIGKELSAIAALQLTSYTDLLAQTVLEVGKLNMGLHLERLSVKSYNRTDRIAVQSIHEPTSRGVVDLVWDWLEAITLGEDFDFPSRIRRLQERFRQSVYGGPTSYSLLRTAYSKGIPIFYLPWERLMQYGYGKYLVRGISTTFDCDSHLDSDFTTYKDDCKEFLANCGFPVPKGKVVYSLEEALAAAEEIGYPVAVKPVVGHKGIGVTANIQGDRTLELAFEQAAAASPHGRIEVIVEQSLTGNDFRLLCAGGQFVAAVERRPPFVIGDGKSTIAELIEGENATEARQDTPTSALAKIIVDRVMENYLDEQRLSLNSVLEEDQLVYLRKVANISSGGVSVEVTPIVHPDNRILAQDIAQYFRLACLGVDVITPDISKSWKEGGLGIIEINSAPGVSMHLNPAIGESVDVPSRILEVFFKPGQPCRMPIITFNRLDQEKLYEMIDLILLRHPNWLVGSVCRDGVWLNRSSRTLQREYNSSVRSLLRHRRLDLLIAEYPEEIFEQEGMFYEGSNLVVLDQPTETERILGRDLLPNGRLIIKEGNEISVRESDLRECYRLAESESFSSVYLKELARLIG